MTLRKPKLNNWQKLTLGISFLISLVLIFVSLNGATPGTSVKVYTNKSAVTRGSNLVITTRVVNNSLLPLQQEFSSTCSDPSLQLGGHRVGIIKGCGQAITTHTIPPLGSETYTTSILVSAEYTSVGTFLAQGHDAQAVIKEPGTYPLTATWGDYSSKPIDITIR